MEQRYAFVAEWYDPHASLVRRYQLLYYPTDMTCEMIDLKNKRLFLRRCKCANIEADDLFIGAVISVQSRQLTIVEFGDDYTSKALKAKMEKTVAIIKPDSISKMADILDRLLSEGFVICHIRMVQLSLKEAEMVYCDHMGKPFFNEEAAAISGGPVVVVELMADRAVSRLREILGPTDPAIVRRDAPTSIRAQFGSDLTSNGCHGSDSAAAAEREHQFFFGGKPFGRNTAVCSDSTLAIIKPHAVKEGLTGKILRELVQSGLSVSALQMFHVEKANSEEFYEVYKGVVREYNSMVEQLCSGPCVAVELTGADAQQQLRELTGPHDPEIARHLRPHTLRAKYGEDKIKNAIHCTDLPDDSILEVEYFFKILDS